MTTYKELFGKAVKYLSTDPTTEAEGQVWYNSTSGTFKSVVVGETMSSSSPIITARYAVGAATNGTQTAALIFAGDQSPPYSNLTEEYNGSGWSNGGNMSTARTDIAGAGTQTAALGFGGYIVPATFTTGTEEYNGTAWTAGGALGTGRYRAGGTGLQTAALAIGGATAISTNTNATEEYNGTAWTAGGSLNTTRKQLGAAGTQTAALGFGGYTTTQVANSEEYDGATWTAGNAMNTARRAFAGGGGTQTSAVAIGGSGGPVVTNVETYDGTNWVTSPATLATARNGGGGGGTGTASLAAAGYSTAVSALTEEYNVSASIITGAAWSSGGTLNTTRNQGNVAGTQTAGLLFGGETPPGGDSAATEEYNGLTWTSGNNMGTGRFDLGLGSAGTQTAALGAGGFINTSGRSTATEEYDGTSWAGGGSLPVGIYEHSVFGTQTAGVINNGTTAPAPGGVNTTLEYDGSTWVSGGNTAVTGFSRGGAGTISAGKTVGARTGPSTFTADVEDYDGTSWTAGTNFFRTIQNTAIGGTQTATLVGNNPLASPSLYSAIYDGTSWATNAALATGRQRLAGTTQLAIAASASGSEEFNGETSALNFKTITTS